MHIERNDGAVLAPGDVIATITGPARGILTAERVALNLPVPPERNRDGNVHPWLQRSETHRTKIVCTRKTTPGLRAIENMRSALAVAAITGSASTMPCSSRTITSPSPAAVTEALKRRKIGVGHLVKIELEVDTLDQLARGTRSRCQTRVPCTRQYGST